MNIEKITPDGRKTVLLLSWRDIKSNKSGGAEVYTHEMLKRADHSKYRFIHISAMFPNAKEKEEIDGVEYIRYGNPLTVIQYAMAYYKKNRDSIDLVVDQCNTHRFFTKFWVERKKRIFFIHQLTREIWFKNASFPINIIGYITETPFLRLSRKDYTMTVSESTKQELIDIGFNPEKTFIIPEGLSFKPWEKEEFKKKEKEFTAIYVGRFVNYKGIDDAVKACCKVKKEGVNIKLWVVGRKNEKYIEEKLKPVMEEEKVSYGGAEEGKEITFWGFVDEEKKYELMSRAHILVFPSIREGWGLIVTEAAAVGTPSIVYNSPGTRDAVNFGSAGYMTKNNTAEELAEILKSAANKSDEYEYIKEKSYEYSKQFHWDTTAEEFMKFIERIK